MSAMSAPCSILHAKSNIILHSPRERAACIIRHVDARNRLKQLIDSRDDLSYANVAKAAGLSNSAVQKYCTGAVQSMTIDNLEKIARAAGVSMRWLLFGEDDTNVVSIFERIPAAQRKQALKVLEAFAQGVKVRK